VTATPADAATTKLQRNRSRMTWLSVVNYTLQSLVIALFAWTGSVAWATAVAFFVASVGISLAFWFVIRQGLNLRLRDPGMLTPQIVSSWLLQVVFIAVAPQLALVFLVCLLVGFNHAMISFTGRQFTQAWLAQGAAIGVALLVAGDRFGYPGASGADVAIWWGFFFLCMYRLTAIGRQYSTLRAKLSEKNHQLQASLERIEQLASHDDLTGALNRRSFMRLLEAERARAERNDQAFCVALLDVDHFKAVNDRFGHATGDHVLKEFSRVVQGTSRVSDVFARYGGEEFIVLLTAPTELSAAEHATERLRAAVERHDWTAVAFGLRVTVSAGVACFRPGESVEQLISRADQALYRAKNKGRNRVMSG